MMSWLWVKVFTSTAQIILKKVLNGDIDPKNESYGVKQGADAPYQKETKLSS